MQRLDALAESSRTSRHVNYEATFRALSAGVQRAPAWLKDRILATGHTKYRVSELAYLLAAMQHSDATVIWRETGDILMASVPADKPRSLIHCIARFEDRAKLDFVIRHLSRSEDSASGTALVALSSLDPLTAIGRLTDAVDVDLYMFRNQWLPLLLRSHPDLTRQRILELAKTEPEKRRLRFIVDLFWERPDELDEAMLRFLLRTLADDLRKRVGGTLRQDQDWLYHPLDFLGRVTRPDLLAICEAEVGDELEQMLVEVACSRLDSNSDFRDHIREGARRVLILMGGKGINSLVTRELESQHFWVRHCGLKWAAVRGDDGVVEKLTAIALRSISADPGEGTESRDLQELYQSTMALAALGADPVLVEILQGSGWIDVPMDLAWLRAHRGPMPKALTDLALRALQRAETKEDSLLAALVIAWLSGDADLIPPVRRILERVDQEGRVAAFACMALQALGDSSDDFLHLAHSLLRTRANSGKGLEALVSMGIRGLKVVASWLAEQSRPEVDDLDCQAIRALYDNPGTKKLSVDMAADRCRGELSLFNNLYDIAAEASDAALRERILDRAFSGPSYITTEPLTAIKGLAKFDVTRAVEAIQLAFRRHPKIERELCRLLVQIAPETGATQLIDSVLTLERDTFAGAAGRALRKLNSEDVSSLLIERMKSLVSERKVAAELAAWLPTSAIAGELGNLADRENDSEVRIAALSALDRHRKEQTVRALFKAFPTATPERRWGLLIAILEAGDPHLLTDRGDRLWLGNILSGDVPAAFAHHARSVLEERKRRET